MNNNINNMTEQEVRNRFRELSRNGDIVATVMYKNDGEMQVEEGWKIIFRNNLFNLGANGGVVSIMLTQNGNFIKIDNYSKFHVVDGILVCSCPIEGDYPESISITFEEHKCVSF